MAESILIKEELEKLKSIIIRPVGDKLTYFSEFFQKFPSSIFVNLMITCFIIFSLFRQKHGWIWSEQHSLLILRELNHLFSTSNHLIKNDDVGKSRTHFITVEAYQAQNE